MKSVKSTCACGRPKIRHSNYCADCHRAYARGYMRVRDALAKLRKKNPELAGWLK